MIDHFIFGWLAGFATGSAFYCRQLNRLRKSIKKAMGNYTQPREPKADRIARATVGGLRSVHLPWLPPQAQGQSTGEAPPGPQNRTGAPDAKPGAPS